MYSNVTIKNWSEDDRPREKMILKGRHALSDSELIAILIGSGTRSKSALELSQELLSRSQGKLGNFAKMSLAELMETKGIGEAKAITLLAALELGRRRKDGNDQNSCKISCSKDAYKLLLPRFSDLQHEEFHVLFLNRANIVQSIQMISKGGIAGTVADGKLIFKAALDQKACGIILSHNHPSGNLNPSEADIKLTKKLREFGNLVDIQVLDHLIITDNGYFSCADNGI